MNNSKQVNFDEYADQYEQLLQEQLSFFSKDRGYFSEYKVKLVSDNLKTTPTRILDFGCGIGLSLPYIKSYFPNAQIFATDLSEASLDHIRNKLPHINVLSDSKIDGYKFDLIFITGVFHHIPPNQRKNVLKRLDNILDNSGSLFIFEHNPYNPVTRHMVDTCPFDEDAELITLKNMKLLINSSIKLHLFKASYCLFFPQKFSFLRFLESYMSKLPLGGQYFVAATK